MPVTVGPVAKLWFEIVARPIERESTGMYDREGRVPSATGMYSMRQPWHDDCRILSVDGHIIRKATEH